MRDLFIACLLVSLAASAALAQSTLHFREGQRIEPDEIATILMNPDGSAVRTRSIRLLPDAADGAGAVTTAVDHVPSALSLPVQFEFDSATILPAARQQLDALAAGIRLLPPDRPVIIEGHTDGTGEAVYNLDLSRRRAAAVKAYLVEVCGAEAPRLRTVGFGESRPIESSDPLAARNRRVEFRGG